MVRKMWKMAMEVKESLQSKNISSFAASTAFFLFLSLVPMLILICTIIPYTPLTEEILVKSITDILPHKMVPFIEEMISEVYEKSAGVLSVAAIVTLWSAGKGMLALRRGLNEINGTEEKRNYFVTRVIATLVLLLAVIISLLLSVFGNVLVETITGKIPQISSVLSFFMPFRFVTVWGLMTIFFTAIYAYVPDKKMQFKKQIPGAAFTAIMWSVLSWGFSLYVEMGGFSIYGSLSIIILISSFCIFHSNFLFCIFTFKKGIN